MNFTETELMMMEDKPRFLNDDEKKLRKKCKKRIEYLKIKNIIKTIIKKIKKKLEKTKMNIKKNIIKKIKKKFQKSKKTIIIKIKIEYQKTKRNIEKPRKVINKGKDIVGNNKV